ASRQPVFRLLSSSVLFSESFLNPSGAPVMRHADKLKLVEGLCGDLHLDPGVVLPKALYVMELNQPVWHDDPEVDRQECLARQPKLHPLEAPALNSPGRLEHVEVLRIARLQAVHLAVLTARPRADLQHWPHGTRPRFFASSAANSVVASSIQRSTCRM